MYPWGHLSACMFSSFSCTVNPHEHIWKPAFFVCPLDVRHFLCTKSELTALRTLEMFIMLSLWVSLYFKQSRDFFLAYLQFLQLLPCTVSLWHLSACLSYKNQSVFYSLPIITLPVYKDTEFLLPASEAGNRFHTIGNLKNMAMARKMHDKFICYFMPTITDNLEKSNPIKIAENS